MRVTASGDANNFNWGSRVLRSDFVDAGLLADYDDDVHLASVYRKLPGTWKNYSY